MDKESFEMYFLFLPIKLIPNARCESQDGTCAKAGLLLHSCVPCNTVKLSSVARPLPASIWLYPISLTAERLFSLFS